MYKKFIIILVLWIGLAFLISPAVEMAYGDDWAYAKPVKEFLETGNIHITDWSSMTLVTHIYWGALFCKLFGFSFTVLRISMLAMGFGGIIATHFFLKEFLLTRADSKVNKFLKRHSVRSEESGFFTPLPSVQNDAFNNSNTANDKVCLFWGSLFIILNPIYIINCYTFYTDITFYTLILTSSIFFIRFLKYDVWHNLILANVFLFPAVLTRDVALVVPPAFIIAYFLRRGFSAKGIVAAIVSLSVVSITYFGFKLWLMNYHGMTANIDFSWNRLIRVYTSGFGWLFIVYAKNIFFTLIFFGLFFFPLVYYSFKKELLKFNKRTINQILIIFFVVFIILVVALFNVPKLYEQTYQLTFNTIYLIYFWLKDVHNPAVTTTFILPKVVTHILLIAGIIGGLFILSIIFFRVVNYFETKQKRYFASLRMTLTDKVNLPAKSDGNIVFICLVILFYIIPILSQGYINRYMLFLLPFFVIFLLYNNSFEYLNINYINKKELKIKKSKFRTHNLFSFSNLFLIIFTFLLAYYSLAGTHDIMAFLRARQEGTEYLEKELRISPSKIDGGFEYNAWHFYDYYYKSTLDKNWWWVQDDEYVVVWDILNNKKYELIKKILYSRWLPPGRTGYQYVYKRIDN